MGLAVQPKAKTQHIIRPIAPIHRIFKRYKPPDRHTHTQTDIPKSSDFPQVREHFSTGDVLQDHVQIGIVLQEKKKKKKKKKKSTKTDKTLLIERRMGFGNLFHPFAETDLTELVSKTALKIRKKIRKKVSE